jgi:membrane-associated protease RseP (regulator of RpoE activity)
VLVDGTVENGPLALRGVKRFDVIYAVNGTQVTTLQSLADYLANVTPGSVLALNINDKVINVTTVNLDGRAVIGLSYGFNYRPCRLGLDRVTTANIYLVLYWTFLVAFSVAVFNMLPAFPFDGEKFLYHSLENFVGKEKRLVLRVVINAVFVGLLVANMALSFWYFGLPSV